MLYILLCKSRFRQEKGSVIKVSERREGYIGIAKQIKLHHTNPLKTKNFTFLQLCHFSLFFIYSCPKVKEGPLSPRDFYFVYNIWQNAGNRTRIAATAARCATNELHTSIPVSNDNLNLKPINNGRRFRQPIKPNQPCGFAEVKC